MEENLRITEDEFKLVKQIEQINDLFIKDGWVHISDESIFCYMVTKEKKEESIKDHSWDILGRIENIVSIYTDNSYIYDYKKQGIEPFLYWRFIENLKDKNENTFISIAEEFILYWNLFENIEQKNKKYHYIDNMGNKEEVIIIEGINVRVKLKYLKEYITIRDLIFVVCFDFMRDTNKEYDISLKDNEIVKNENIIYNHTTRGENISSKYNNWILGKVYIDGNKDKKYTVFGNYDDVEFITGYDNNGKEIKESYDMSKENSYWTEVYFEREVLNRYYDDPSCEVDSLCIKMNNYTLKCDNNNRDYVMVYLSELSKIPNREQQYWKGFNIHKNKDWRMSYSFSRCYIAGEWDSINYSYPEFYFKYIYMTFNDNFRKKYGYNFYNPFEGIDTFILKSLHTPISDNRKSFTEQLLSIQKVVIEKINSKKLNELIKEKNFKGCSEGGSINILCCYLENFHQYSDNQGLIEFLRNLQNLRSFISAHTVKDNNEALQSFEYFALDIEKGNYTDTFEKVFQKSIKMINTIIQLFDIKDF